MFLWYWLRYLYFYVIGWWIRRKKKNNQEDEMWPTNIRSKAIAWPWECDLNLHLNTASQISEAEYERCSWHFASYFMEKKPDFYWVMASIMTTYRRQIPMFCRYEKRYNFIGYDERFWYFRQTFYVKGKIATMFFLKLACVDKKTHKMVPVEDACKRNNIPFVEKMKVIPETLKNWAAAEQTEYKKLELSNTKSQISNKQTKKQK
ncbi:hypothetical protein M0813_10161 [Anaeramoeba flamelloides]|uniref:Thioesterase n=1 Tax=Anaeramoeba flamelloides TaxID=1746091 RepID=A0ABQ8X710_9EUKA|nr:hypothetical protein M0813_10161 [Anaeramoeba flamelloides]